MMSKVNPNEAPEGFVAVEEFNGCDTCAFIEQKDTCHGNHKCTPSRREDGCDVIFKKKPEGMTFEEILPLLRQGKLVRRDSMFPSETCMGMRRGELALAHVFDGRIIWDGAHVLTEQDICATSWKKYNPEPS